MRDYIVQAEYTHFHLSRESTSHASPHHDLVSQAWREFHPSHIDLGVVNCICMCLHHYNPENLCLLVLPRPTSIYIGTCSSTRDKGWPLWSVRAVAVMAEHIPRDSIHCLTSLFPVETESILSKRQEYIPRDSSHWLNSRFQVAPETVLSKSRLNPCRHAFSSIPSV